MAEVNDIYRGRLITDDGASQMGANILYYLCQTKGGTGATDAQIATALDTAAAAPYKALLANGARYRGAGMAKVLPLPGFTENFSVAGAGPGTAGAEMLPRQTCGLITWRTPFSGARFRGRTYVSFPSETDNQSTAIPTSSYLTRLGTLAVNIGALSAGTFPNQNTFTLGIFHRDLLTINIVIPPAFLQVRWATQRRRGSYGQPNTPPF